MSAAEKQRKAERKAEEERLRQERERLRQEKKKQIEQMEKEREFNEEYKEALKNIGTINPLYALANSNEYTPELRDRAQNELKMRDTQEEQEEAAWANIRENR